MAYAAIGRNVLFVALVTHVAALFLSMTPDFGVRSYFNFLYVSCWALLVAGLYTELRDRGYRPFGEYRFYLVSFLAILPIVGPLAVLIALYSLQGAGNTAPFSTLGMIGSFFRLRANSIVVVLLLLVLSALFAYMYSTHDPYFKRMRQGNTVSPGG